MGEHLAVQDEKAEKATLGIPVSPIDRFNWITRKRLAPFVPEFRHHNTTDCTQESIRPEPKWHPIDESGIDKVALVPGRNDAILLSSGGTVKCIAWTRPRLSLLD